MDPGAINTIVEQLNGLEWCLFSGAAAAVYATDDRPIGDLDIAVAANDLYIFADRLDTTVEHRSFEKNGVTFQDHGFNTVFNGVEIEATNGFPPSRVEQGTFQKVFDQKVEATFHGEPVALCPIEDLFILKAVLYREKDRRDLERLNTHAFDPAFLNELLGDWDADEPVRERLTSCGITY